MICLWADMSKPITRPYSRYSREAVLLLGQLIRRNRIEHKLTMEQLAERAGLSRGLLQRIEKGDPSSSIGAFFEAAAIVGVRLFDADQAALTSTLSSNGVVLTLLPKAVHTPKRAVKDDF
jgi:transcriptional regulator with XRE-family HTH domain